MVFWAKSIVSARFFRSLRRSYAFCFLGVYGVRAQQVQECQRGIALHPVPSE